MTIAAGLILSAVFFILLFLGVPISVSIAAASIVTMLTIFLLMLPFSLRRKKW